MDNGTQVVVVGLKGFVEYCKFEEFSSKDGNMSLGQKCQQMLRTLVAMLICLVVVGCSSPAADKPVAEGSPSGAASPSEPKVSSSPTPGSDSKPVRLQKTVIKTKQGQRWELEAEEVDWMDD